MTTSVTLQAPRPVWETPQAKPLNEAVWQAWVAKGRAQEWRSGALHLKAAKWASIAALAAAAVLWSHIASYDVVVRFLVTAASMVVMFQAFHTGRYGSAALFGALALLFNPLAPVFGFSGNWQRAVVLASVFPFVASLTWRGGGKKHND
jgi:hypothetical protein